MSPFAEDLTLGKPLASAPDVTLDSGMAAQYLAICGDQLQLTLSDPLSLSVCGQGRRLVNPALLLSASIGQSTVATKRVIANLRYDNVALERQVYIGETVRTVVTPLAAAWTRSGTERAKVLLGMQLTTSAGETLATYQRLALLPVAEPQRLVVTEIPTPAQLPLASYERYVPSEWTAPAAQSPAIAPGTVWVDPLVDTVSSARELVRLTQNQAAAHRDYRAGIGGKRLAYGGHAIGLAQASLSRMLPDLLTVLGWRSCDHLAPVFEDDLLQFSSTVVDIHSYRGFRLLDVSVLAHALRDEALVAVLEWRVVLLLRGGIS